MKAQKKWEGKTALVTGASSGIGTAFASALAKGGCNLILTARRLDRLENLASELAAEHGVNVDSISQDLSEPGSARALAGEIEKKDLQVDLLINNAGVGVSGSFVNVDWDRTARMLQLNISTLVELTHIFLSPMIERGGGDILIVGSVGAYMPTPTLACYSASKSFVKSFGHALAYELKGTGVNVTVLNPGGTRTEWMATAGHEAASMSDMGQMSPEEVVKIGLRAMAKGKLCEEPGAMYKALAMLSPVMPLRAQMSFARLTQKVIGGQE